LKRGKNTTWFVMSVMGSYGSKVPVKYSVP
jgi:hypothetical protein